MRDVGDIRFLSGHKFRPRCPKHGYWKTCLHICSFRDIHPQVAAGIHYTGSSIVAVNHQYSELQFLLLVRPFRFFHVVSISKHVYIIWFQGTRGMWEVILRHPNSPWPQSSRSSCRRALKTHENPLFHDTQWPSCFDIANTINCSIEIPKDAMQFLLQTCNLQKSL